MPKITADYTQGDWYDLPDYYDAIFDQDSAKEAGFLEGIWLRFGGGRRRGRHKLRILEPACGSGRLVLELAKRGHQVEGFDANPRMLDAAQCKLGDHKLRAKLRPGILEKPPSNGRYDLAHCLLSTFKYIRAERDAVAHLQTITDQLVRGGLYVLGIHLTDYRRTRNDTERWTGHRVGADVICETTTFPPNARSRSEKLRNRLTVRPRAKAGQRRPPPQQIETHWICRTYSESELRKLLAKIPELECAACFDFTHDLESPKEFDDTQEDIVLILKKR